MFNQILCKAYSAFNSKSMMKTELKVTVLDSMLLLATSIAHNN